MQQHREPFYPTLVPNLTGDALNATYTKYNNTVAEYNLQKEAYNKALLVQEERQGKAYIAIQLKYGYNNFQKIKTKKRAYQMLEILCSSRSTSARKLIRLTTYFYGLTLVDYKSIANFSS